MLDNKLSFDYDGDSFELTRVNQDNFASTYQGGSDEHRISMKISHTLPKKGGTGESHLVRFDVEEYSPEGLYLRTTSAWSVVRTADSAQMQDSATAATGMLAQFLGSANLPRVLSRES